MQLVSLYQTGSTALNFANCEKDSGGSGYASGIVNFTTRNGDALKVIQEYLSYNSGSYNGTFDEYLPTLKKYASKGSGSTKGLSGYCDAWEEAAQDNLFWNAQSSVLSSEYNAPIQEYVDEIKIKFSVTRAILYDTAIVNGLGSSDSDLGGIFKATNAAFYTSVEGDSGNSVVINNEYSVDELMWALKFLDIRESSSDSGSKNIAAYRSIIARNDLTWDKDVTVEDSDGKEVTVSCTKPASMQEA
ncbi:hypothetical protein IWW50_001610 [Coemansia erecta]|nr:hypothetical protein IWW50_001610 [Coemansia erecta]